MELKKRILIMVIVTIIGLIIIFTIPLSKNNNWNKELINNYYIEKKSDIDIKLYKDNKVIISDYIAEYSYGERYILLKCLENKQNINIKFYIIDTINNEIYGPYIDYETYKVIKDEVVKEETNNFIKTIGE